MHFLVALLLAPVWAKTLKVQTKTAVYQSPTIRAHVLFYLRPGESIEVEPVSDEFFRMHLKRGPRTLTGFVEQTEVELQVEDPRSWAFGLGGKSVSFVQKGKTFQGDDQVQYTTSDYNSTSFASFLTAQWGERDFWRVELSYFKTNYTTTATQDVIGSQAQAIKLQQTFLMAILEKAWSPFDSHAFYFGLGAELGKAIAVNLTLGGAPLTTTSSDLPIYVGVLGFVGGQWFLGPVLSVFAQARVSVVADQQPMILGYEGVVGLMYWP